MIEVEKKFKLTPEQEVRLLEGATFLKTVTNEDIYFDTIDFSLTKQDHWLRKRSGRFELKRRVHELGHKLGGTAYDEIEDEAGIRTFLKLPEVNALEADLASAGYNPFAKIEGIGSAHRMLASTSSQHLESEPNRFGNPQSIQRKIIPL